MINSFHIFNAWRKQCSNKDAKPHMVNVALYFLRNIFMIVISVIVDLELGDLGQCTCQIWIILICSYGDSSRTVSAGIMHVKLKNWREKSQLLWLLLLKKHWLQLWKISSSVNGWYWMERDHILNMFHVNKKLLMSVQYINKYRHWNFSVSSWWPCNVTRFC